MNTESTSQRIGFVGLGTMGAPMAGHLLAAGHTVCAHNRSMSKAEAWLAQHQHTHASIADSVAELAQTIDVLVMCIGNDEDVRSTVQAALAHLPAGAVIIDHTTTSAALAQEMATLCAAQGVTFLDCPVSGGQAGAINGKLTVMAGGDAVVFEAMRPIIAAYSAHQQHFGAAGAGQAAKMVNQILVVSVLQGLAEGMTLARHLNLDVTALVDTLKRGAAGSWQLENRGVTMSRGEFDFGFAIDWAIKDLAIVAEAAQALNLQLPLTEQTLGRYRAISAAGHGREDTSALIRQFELPR